MFLAVRHTTAYAYDEPVDLYPHIIRLTPRADAYRRLVERTLTIIPEPDVTSVALDHNGNLSHTVWFKRPTAALTVISRMVLELNEANPFDFIVYPEDCVDLPMQYPAAMASQLAPFLADRPTHPKVNAFAVDLMEESKHHVVTFATLLCRKIKEECTYEIRSTGDPHLPEKVLSHHRGSCRDLAVLYIAAARAVGLAARFVSGYYFDQSPKHPQLHAWAEVYIPGGGWRAYDPTLGLACYGHHIALAATATTSEAAAIEGTFFGSPGSHMDVTITYEYLRTFSSTHSA